MGTPAKKEEAKINIMEIKSHYHLGISGVRIKINFFLQQNFKNSIFKLSIVEEFIS
jgi:hypothetical protein